MRRGRSRLHFGGMAADPRLRKSKPRAARPEAAGGMPDVARRLLAGELELADGNVLRVQAGVVDDELRVDIPDPGPFQRFSVESRIRRTADAIRAAVPIAKLLGVPDDVAARIAGDMARDPRPELRMRSLLALIREFPDSPATRETLCDIASRAPPLVLLAAQHPPHLPLDGIVHHVRVGQDDHRVTEEHRPTN